MKRKTAFLLVIACAFFLVLGGCQFGGKRDKLTICLDFGLENSQTNAFKSFLNWLDDYREMTGRGPTSEEIEVEVISPDGGSERQTELTRIRTEIMAGRGPDIFLCATTRRGFNGSGDEMQLSEGGRLFPYVKKSIDDGLFLALDDYLNGETLSVWEEYTPAIMDAGKDQDGLQRVLPLTFSVPLNVFYKEEVGTLDYTGKSWSDVCSLEDSLFAEQSPWVAPFWSGRREYIRKGTHDSALSALFPELADFRNDKLLISEDDLFRSLSDGFSTYQKIIGDENAENVAVFFTAKSVEGNRLFNQREKDLSFLPLRNQVGGTTAFISLYCAVNANTNRPEDAFAVCDALLCRNFQQSGNVYTYNAAMPTNRHALYTSMHYAELLQFSEQQLEEWLRVCDDVNVARFPSPLDQEIHEMTEEIEAAMMEAYPPSQEPGESWQYVKGSINEEQMKQIIHKHYETMEHLLGEA